MVGYVNLYNIRGDFDGFEGVHSLNSSGLKVTL